MSLHDLDHMCFETSFNFFHLMQKTEELEAAEKQEEVEVKFCKKGLVHHVARANMLGGPSVCMCSKHMKMPCSGFCNI